MQFNAKVVVKFDRSVIKRRWKRDNKDPLKKAGAYTRGIAIRSIRTDRTKKKSPSKPGMPPKSRASGHPIKLIFFSVSPLNTSCIVGPVGFTSKQRKKATELHEHGGTVVRKVIRRRKQRRKAGTRNQAQAARRQFLKGNLRQEKADEKTTAVTYPERPFMYPAMRKASEKYPELWRNFLKK